MINALFYLNFCEIGGKIGLVLNFLDSRFADPIMKGLPIFAHKRKKEAKKQGKAQAKQSKTSKGNKEINLFAIFSIQNQFLSFHSRSLTQGRAQK